MKDIKNYNYRPLKYNDLAGPQVICQSDILFVIQAQLTKWIHLDSKRCTQHDGKFVTN